MQQSLREREDEIRDLRRQMRGLKEWVSNSTRADATGAAQQVSDEVFGAGMSRLGNELQNWVLVNFRRAKVKVDGEGVRGVMGRVVPMFEEILALGGKIHLIQSVVSMLLVEMVFGAYFVGLTGEQERVIREAEEMLEAIGMVHSVGWTLEIVEADPGGLLSINTRVYQPMARLHSIDPETGSRPEATS